MYFTHHFANAETMTRARSWLAHLGYGPHQFQTRTAGTPTVTISVPASQWAEVGLLINALERSDPDGFRSFWEDSRRPHVGHPGDEEIALAERATPQSAIIGWHPQDATLSADPELRRVLEGMSH